LLRRVIGNFAAELLFERHDEFDGIEAVGAKVVDEAGVVGNLRFLNPKMLDDYFLNALRDIAHARSSPELSTNDARRIVHRISTVQPLSGPPDGYLIAVPRPH